MNAFTLARTLGRYTAAVLLTRDAETGFDRLHTAVTTGTPKLPENIAHDASRFFTRLDTLGNGEVKVAMLGSFDAGWSEATPMRQSA